MNEQQKQSTPAVTQGEPDEVARTIAEQLGETEDEPLRLLRGNLTEGLTVFELKDGNLI